MSDPLATVRTMQSEQARQRKRERKRLEREKKRRRSQAGLLDEMDLFFEWRPRTRWILRWPLGPTAAPYSSPKRGATARLRTDEPPNRRGKLSAVHGLG